MILTYLKKNKHFGVLFYFIIIFLLYFYTEKNVEPRYYLYSELDDRIPFVKEMVIPYVLWYLYIGGSLLFFGLNSRKDFLKLCTFLFLGMTVCFLIYLKFPNGHNLRPFIIEQDLFSDLIRFIYRIDTPTNSAPSIHVIASVGIHLAIIKCEIFERKLYSKFTSLLIMISIIASTVMIKQHSIIDVFLGLLVSTLLYLIIYIVPIASLKPQTRYFLPNNEKSGT